MKHILLLVFLLISLSAYSQEHLTFKGMPIDGLSSVFVSSLKAKGYEQTYKDENGNYIMTGSFTGKNADLYILATRKSHIVWKVVVSFDQLDSWTSLKSVYNDYIDLFSKKYGRPKRIETFKSPYYEGDGYELQALRLEKCIYFTYFETPLGDISIEISNDAKIKLSYEDKINLDLKHTEQNSLDLDEI
jgi:hypothetical protein